jgi:hypothetical protein
MNDQLTEEEMRRALFNTGPISTSSPKATAAPTATTSKVLRKPVSTNLRVTLSVQKEFEGDSEIFTYDSQTMSTVMAEMEAIKQAKAKRFRYFQVVKVAPY